MAQKINQRQTVNNFVRVYGYRTSNWTTTSASYVDTGVEATITTKGGLIEVNMYQVAYVTANTSFLGIQINGVDYEVAMVSNSFAEVGYSAHLQSPTLAAGTYTVKIRGKANAGSTLTLTAYRDHWITVKEVGV